VRGDFMVCRAVMFSIPASALVWKDGPWGVAADHSGHVRIHTFP
jgi:hypothetical protein